MASGHTVEWNSTIRQANDAYDSVDVAERHYVEQVKLITKRYGSMIICV